MYDVGSTHAGKLVSNLGAQASLLTRLPPSTQVLQTALPAPQVRHAEGSSDGIRLNRRSSMHLSLPWGGSAFGLPAQAEQHAGWRPDWLLHCLL